MIGPVRAHVWLSLAASAGLLVVGLAPAPQGRLRSAWQGVRSPEGNRADREANAGGYYEGLIGGGAGPGGRDVVALRLLGKPTNWISFHDMGATRYLAHDFLQFDLYPDVDRPVFDGRFTTNSLGLRDRDGYAREKPAGTFRIALLGSSMDMGWGVGVDETYENRLEDWLNRHAARRGLARRFEVMNFAMAAYGPAQRLESYRRKAAAFEPDLVLYSVTMLDTRLTQIHLCDLLQGRADPTYDFLRAAIAAAKIAEADLARDDRKQLVHKDAIKRRLAPELWPIADGALGTLAADCRAAGRPVVCLIVPRVGLADAPGARDGAVARHRAIAARHAVPVVDLSATFDDEDPVAIEIAAWDDHPNARGHELLFLALARALVADDAIYRIVFDAEPIRTAPMSGFDREGQRSDAQ